MAAIDHALSLLRGAILNARIYPAGSQIIQQPIDATYEALSACLKETPRFTISDFQGKLMLNDTTEIHPNTILQELIQHDVQIITVSSGLTKVEVGLLVTGFAKTKKDPEMAEGLPAWLTKNGVQHIALAQAHYVAVREGEKVANQVKTLFGAENYEMTAALISRLEQSLRELDGLPQEAIRKRKAEIIADLTHRSVQELQALVETDLPEAFFQTGFSQSLVQSLSLEKSEQFFDLIVSWAGGLTPQDQASELTQIKMQRLRRFLKSLIETPGARLISSGMLEKLAQFRLVESAPAGFLEGTESFSVIAYVEHLLALPLRAVLKENVQVRLAQVVQSLCAIGADPALRKLVDHIVANLSDEDPSNRAAAVKSLELVESKIHSSQRKALLEVILKALCALAEVEGASLVYEEIARSLARSALIALTENRSNEAVEVLQLLARHRTEGHPQFQARRALASKALSYFAAESIGILSHLLQSTSWETKEEGIRILHLLDEDAGPFYLELAKRPGNALLSQVAVSALRQMGPAVRGMILDHIHLGVPAPVLLRLLPAVEAQNDPVILQKGLDLLRHPDGHVRLKALSWVASVPGLEAEEGLLRMLDDPEPEVRIEAISQVREHDMRRLTPALVAILPGASPEIQDQILLALALWKAAVALPVVADLLLGPKKIFFRKGSTAPSSIRTRCAWVLGQYLPDPMAKAWLKQVLRDKDPQVQRHAQAALRP
jgi:hypothetical protein